MRKKFMKATAIGMSVMMVLGLTACGGSGGSSSGEAEKATLTESGFPIVEGEPLEMTCFTMSMPNVEDLDTNDFTKFLEETTGIKMTFETGGRDDWEDKLNMTLQSGDYPDIILGVAPNVAKYGVKEGIFLQLDDLINEENCPNYMKMMGQYLDLQREADGHIYSLSGINDCYHCSYGRKMWINTYHLEQMGLEIPTTTEEFYNVCEKFMEYKPDGIAIGGTAQGSGWYSVFQDWLMGSFLLCPRKSATLNVYDYTAVRKEDGQIVCAATDDRYKEFMKYCNSLYELGAIYDGDFTQTQEQFKSIVNQADEPVLCFPEGTISDYIDSTGNPELYKHYAAIAPLEGPDGTRLTTFFKYDAVGGSDFVITDKCENPEAALRWVDFFFTETGDLCSQYGAEEGVDWALDPEGQVGVNGEPALYEVLNAYSAETQNHDWQDIGIRVAPADYRLGQAVEAADPYSPNGLEQLLYNASKELYEPYNQDAQNSDLDVVPELKFTDEEAGNVSTSAVEVEKVINETSVAFITGAKDVEKEWDSYKESLEKAGLSQLLEAYQVAYDRQQAN